MEGAVNITLSVGEHVFQVTVPRSLQMSALRTMVELEAGRSLAGWVAVFNGSIQRDDASLERAGVADNDLVMFAPQQPEAPAGAARPTQSEAARVRQFLAQNPDQMRRIQHSDAELAQALAQPDDTRLEAVLQARMQRRRQQEEAQRREIERLNADPMNVEAQKRIEEAIRMESVNENMSVAMEHNPEAFGRVVMLYVDCEVNGRPLKAFVDSGAQMTIMSLQCARQCGVEHLIDKRFAGMALGVGTSKILGRVHIAQIKIGGSFFPISLTILEDNKLEFLLGLDMLRRHQCCIDLRDNVLAIGDERAPFLAEKDIPSHLRISAEGTLQESREGAPSGSSASPAPLTGAAPTPAPATTPPSVNPPAAEMRMDVEAPAPTPAATAEAPSEATFPEEVVQTLMGLGFDRARVIQMLRLCNGNPDLAASQLMFS